MLIYLHTKNYNVQEEQCWVKRKEKLWQSKHMIVWFYIIFHNDQYSKIKQKLHTGKTML